MPEVIVTRQIDHSPCVDRLTGGPSGAVVWLAPLPADYQVTVPRPTDLPGVDVHVPRSFAAVRVRADGGVLALDTSRGQLLRFTPPATWSVFAGPPTPAPLQRLAVMPDGAWLVADASGQLWAYQAFGWALIGTAPGAPLASLAVSPTGGVWALSEAGELRSGAPNAGPGGGPAWQVVPGPPGVSMAGGALAVDRVGTVWLALPAAGAVYRGDLGRGWAPVGGARFGGPPLQTPGAVAVDAGGTLWVLDRADGAVYQLGPGGWQQAEVRRVPLAVAGRWAVPGGTDLAVDSDGGVYVAAGQQLRLRAFWTSSAQGNARWWPDGRFVWESGPSFGPPDQVTLPTPFGQPQAGGGINPIVVQIGVGVAPGVTPPTLAPVTVTTARDLPIAIALHGTPGQGGALTFAVVGEPASGTVTSGAAAGDPSGRLLVVTPAKGALGAIAAQVKAVEGGVASAAAQVFVQVVEPPRERVEVPAAGAIVLPSPGGFGGLSGRMPDPAALAWRSVRWPGLAGPVGVVSVPEDDSLWVSSPGYPAVCVWRRGADGSTTAYGGDAGIAPMTTALGVSGRGSFLAVADPGLACLWTREPRFGIWSRIGGAPGAPWGLALAGTLVYATLPDVGQVVGWDGVLRVWTKVCSTAGGGPTAPLAVAVDGAGAIWVTDREGDSVFRWANGAWTAFSAAGSSVGPLQRPRGLAVDAGGVVWIADTLHDRLITLAAPADPGARPVWTRVGDFEATLGPLCQPQGVAIDARGVVWVADTGNNRVIQRSCFVRGALVDAELRRDGSVRLVSNGGAVGEETIHLPTACGVPGVPAGLVPSAATRLDVTVTAS